MSLRGGDIVGTMVSVDARITALTMSTQLFNPNGNIIVVLHRPEIGIRPSPKRRYRQSIYNRTAVLLRIFSMLYIAGASL